MLPASDRPFDASRHAYRTDVDGLVVQDTSALYAFEDATTSFTDALNNFESADKSARESYNKEKENGLTTDAFKDWMWQSYPEWDTRKTEAKIQGAAVRRFAMKAFGYAYGVKSQQGEVEFAREATAEGFEAELF